MIARTLMVVVVGVTLAIGSTGCRPKNGDGTTASAQAKPKRTWWGLGPPKKQEPEIYSATTVQEPKPKRTWWGLGPPKKPKAAPAPAQSQAVAQAATPARTSSAAPAAAPAPAHTQVPAARPAPTPAPVATAPPAPAPGTTAPPAPAPVATAPPAPAPVATAPPAPAPARTAAAPVAPAPAAVSPAPAPAPQAAQPINGNRSSRFKSAAQTEPRQASMQVAADSESAATPAPRAPKRGWFGWGSRRDTGPAYVAQGERVETDMAEAVEIDVLANEGASRRDLDLEKIITGPRHGSARIRERKNASGQEIQSIVYTPQRGFSGDDRIRYRVERDGEKSEADAIVHVRRRGVLKIEANIDHKDVIMIRGNEMWFRNLYGVPPSDARVNGRSVDLGYGLAPRNTMGDSKKVRFEPSMPGDRPSNVSATGGPDAEGELILVDTPRPENNYTTVLMLSDPREGVRKWDIEVRFDAE